LVDKVSESNFDKMNSDLEMFECLCVIDYKMKVLPKSYREKMIDWYSKRGISVLRVELHLMVDGEKKSSTTFSFQMMQIRTLRLSYVLSTFCTNRDISKVQHQKSEIPV